MAVSAAELNAVCDVKKTGKGPFAIKHAPKAKSATTDNWYIRSGTPGGARSKWVTTTRSDSAATQGAAILTAMADPTV